MDGPSIKWTVADLSKVGGNKTFLAYHVMGSGYGYLTPLGCVLGGLLGPKVSSLTALQAAGSGGIMAGTAGMGLGLMAMVKTSMKKEPKIPWDTEGIQQRVDGISHNYRIRALDLGVWMGIAAGAGALVYSGGPTKLGLSPGITGNLQAIALGSAAGSVTANIVIALTK